MCYKLGEFGGRNQYVPSAPKPGSSMNSWKNFWKTQFPNAPKSGSSMSGVGKTFGVKHSQERSSDLLASTVNGGLVFGN